MKFYKYLSVLLLIAVTLSAFLAQKRPERKTQTTAPGKPNVILILVDDLGWTDLGAYGSDLYQTPNVDALAKDGIRFTDAYSACTVCSPTRASLMTGKYPARLHCTDWIAGHKKPYAKLQVPDWTMYLADSEYTLAEAMKDNGYTTAHIGKWHLGEAEKNWPERHGFDLNLAGWSAGSPVANGGKGYFSPYANPRLTDGPAGEYLTERLADEAAQFIRTNKDKPFFLNYWLYQVHTPLQAKKEKIEKYKALVKAGNHHINPTYAAMVEHMDEALGKVVRTLKETGQYENTILIFYSDNGGLRGNYENGRKTVTDNFPLRSGKGDVFEGGVRVPLIISWPAKIKADRESNVPAISPDIYPTVLSLTGGKVKPSLQPVLDGVDLSGLLLANKTPNRKAIFWHYPHYHLEGAKPYSAVRMGDWKLVEVFEQDSLQLFNLKQDIGETRNLANTNPAKTKELHNALIAWRKQVGAQMPTKNPNHDPAKEETWGSAKGATGAGSDKNKNE
ncbi:sulfatase [Rudanella lutea]|uniref:sulfatase n=1 Tax=Rudanella lutea TaxID=451374 RepID=UPI00037EAED4|nr:sulfatase [Rudanella lutea]